MATPNSIVAGEGFDIYPAGQIATNFPWSVITTANPANIVASSGAFTDTATNSLTIPTGTTTGTAVAYDFPNGGLLNRTSTAANAKAVFGFNGWVKVDANPAAGSYTLLSLGNSGISTSIVLLGVNYAAATGLSLVLPATLGSSTGANLLPIEAGKYYWLDMKLAWCPTGQAFATYVVDGIVMYDNIPLSWNADLLGGTAVINRLHFLTTTSTPTYRIDDMVLQASNGGLANWPAGFTTGTPNNPTANTLPTLPPSRIPKLAVTGNGSLTQWTPSDGGPNYLAATTPGKYVESNASNQTDLYKVAAPSTSTGCVGVIVRASSTRYLNVQTASKDSSAAALTTNPGVGQKGVARFMSVLEQTNAGEVWNQTRIGAAEFGQNSI